MSTMEKLDHAHGRFPKNPDETDRKILAELKRNGRVTNVDLAKKVGLSPTPCLERVRNLERRGFISGYTVVLNYRLLGLPVSAIAMVTLDKSRPGVFEEFRDFVLAEPAVTDCQFVSGSCDCVLRVRVAGLPEYNDFLRGKLLARPGIVDVRSNFVLDDVSGS